MEHNYIKDLCGRLNDELISEFLMFSLSLVSVVLSYYDHPSSDLVYISAMFDHLLFIIYYFCMYIIYNVEL